MAQYRLKAGTSFNFLGKDNKRGRSIELDTINSIFSLSNTGYTDSGFTYYRINEFNLSNIQGSYLYLAINNDTKYYILYIGNDPSTSKTIAYLYGNLEYDNGEFAGILISLAQDTIFTEAEREWLFYNTDIILGKFEALGVAITIKKEVESTFPPDKQKQFTFHINVDNIYESFSLADGETKTYTDVKIGSSISIREDNVIGSVFNLFINQRYSSNGVYQGTVPDGGGIYTFTNVRQPAEAAQLIVTKVVDGVSSDDTEFWFTLTMTSDNVEWSTEATQTIRFSLRHNGTRIFTASDFKEALSLRMVDYTIVEDEQEGYTAQTPTVYGTIRQATEYVILHNTKDGSEVEPGPGTTFYDIKEGDISGTGETSTRTNEITSDNVAVFRNFVLGYNGDIKDLGGVMDIESHNFLAQKKDAITISITDGTCFAFGYVGHCYGRDIGFFPPAVEQYQIIYAEIDKSVIPNSISIKTKSNQSSNTILLNTFRQDALSIIKTGKFQVPLWLVRLSNKGIEELKSERPLRKCIDNVVYADYTKHISGIIASNAIVEGDMKPLDTNDKTVATTEWAKAIIEQEIRR